MLSVVNNQGSITGVGMKTTPITNGSWVMGNYNANNVGLTIANNQYVNSIMASHELTYIDNIIAKLQSIDKTLTEDEISVNISKKETKYFIKLLIRDKQLILKLDIDNKEKSIWNSSLNLSVEITKEINSERFDLKIKLLLLGI